MMDARVKPGQDDLLRGIMVQRTSREGASMEAYRYLTGKDDAAFCHRVTKALNEGWQLYGDPTLTFDAVKGEVVCGQAIVKEARDKTYSPETDLAKV